MGRLRRPGGRWRLKVDEWQGRRPGDRDGSYGVSHTVTPDAAAPEPTSEWARVHRLPNTEFDELVIEKWLHVEQMNATDWWMNIAGIVIDITVDRDGRPTGVMVHGPGDHDNPAEGCRYELVWSRDATEVWSALELPGGYVCAHPVPAEEPGIDHQGVRICGTPTESEPCRIHNPKGWEAVNG